MRTDNDTNVLTSFAIEVSEENKALNILIKHDYYSSDNDNGRFLLKQIIRSVLESGTRIGTVIIVDTGVRLLETSDDMIMLISNSVVTFICEQSLSFYEVSPAEAANTKIQYITGAETADLILEIKPDIIIE